MTQTTLITWDEKPAAPQQFIMGAYSVMDPPQVFRVCRRQCCVDAGFGPQRLPMYWRDATPQEVEDCWWVKQDCERKAARTPTADELWDLYSRDADPDEPAVGGAGETIP